MKFSTRGESGLRLLAISLIAVGPVLAGFHQARQGGQRVAQMQALIAVLDELGRELAFQQAQLLAIFQRSEHELLRCCAEALAQVRPPSMRQIWAMGLEGCFPLLDGAELEMAKQVGQVLGRYDARRQCEVIAQVRQALSIKEQALREESQRSGKVSWSLGMSAGAFIFIILI